MRHVIFFSNTSSNLLHYYTKALKKSIFSDENFTYFWLLWQHNFLVFHLSPVLRLNKSAAELFHGHQLFYLLVAIGNDST